MSEAETPIKYWDVNLTMEDPNHKAFVIVEGRDKHEAEAVARGAALKRWPGEDVKEIKVQPSKTSRKERRKMGMK